MRAVRRRPDRREAVGILIAMIAVVSGACADGELGLAQMGETPSDPHVPETIPEAVGSLHAIAFVNAVRAGQSVTVRCLESDGAGWRAPDEPATLEVTPAVHDLVQSEGTGTFSPTTARPHRVSCRRSDGKVGAGVAEIAVAPDAAFAWTVDERSGECFTPADLIIFEIAVEDRYGNALSSDAVSATISPNAGFAGDLHDGFRFHTGGTYTITLTYGDAIASDGSVTPHLSTVRIDKEGPVVSLHSMSDNAFLVGDPARTPLVGTISDESSDLVDVRIDDEPLSITGGRTMSIDLQHAGRWGLSVVEIAATDACGNETRTVVPTLRSQAFYPPTTGSDTRARVGSALRVQTTQSLIDDRDRSDVDDLATLAELALGTVDFDQLIVPGQFLAQKSAKNDCDGCPFGNTYASSGYRAVRHPSGSRHMAMNGPYVTGLDIVSGGVTFTMEATTFSLPIDVDVHIQQCALGCSTDDYINVDGSLGASQIQITGRIGVSNQGSAVLAALETVNVATHGVWIDLDCGAFDWACDSFEDNIAERVRVSLEDGIATAIEQTVSPLLETSSQSLEISRVIDLPSPFDMRLGVDVGLEQLTFAAGAQPRASASMYAQLFPLSRGSDIAPRQHGAIRRPTAGAAPLPAAQSALALRMDVLNQVLWSLWYGGGLVVDDLSVLGDTFSSEIWSGRAVFGMPPVVMPSDAPNTVDLGLGGISVLADVDVGQFLGGESYEISIQIDLSAVVQIEITLDEQNNAIRIAAVGEPVMWAEVAHVSDPTYTSFVTDYIEDTLGEAFVPHLDGAVAEMPLPTMDLSSIPGVPANTVWSLHDAGLALDGDEVQLWGRLGP